MTYDHITILRPAIYTHLHRVAFPAYRVKQRPVSQRKNKPRVKNVIIWHLDIEDWIIVGLLEKVVILRSFLSPSAKMTLLEGPPHLMHKPCLFVHRYRIGTRLPVL